MARSPSTSKTLRLLLTLLALFQLSLSTPITQTQAEPTPTRPRAANAPPQSTSMFWLDYTKSYDPLAPDPTKPARAENAEDPDFVFAQTTYYTCITRGTKEHCGWHAPILWVAEAGGERRSRRVDWGMWGIAAVAVGVVMLV
ncbi:hypothetical protein jhhlp_007567 [Lomentospora prolificans]|uniref:Ig-like domain-containing protein n=1 Tax=Lomentospora prolificans TaxID=41688 RepID=A0A2N3MZY6_9PEZI|nr:hypothetical protein jhhlp_007567 [Lomentospora prolificans]